MKQEFNTRILIIDDDEGVRNSFREILQPANSGAEAAAQLAEASTILFSGKKSQSSGETKRSSATFNFEFDEASNGQNGYEMVKTALEKKRPYAAIFVDMRMPGWDGLETVGHLREIDQRCEIIFVTAYSDHSIEEIVTSVGTNVSYHCKPFSVEEIEQIATKAVYEWNKIQTLENLIQTISKLRAQQWQMEPLLKNILEQVSYLIGAHSALIALRKEGTYQKLLATGNLCDEDISCRYLCNIPELSDDEMYQNDEYAYFNLHKYGVLAVFDKGGRPLNQERTYLVRLFLEQAMQSIQNVGLQDKLLRQEKLSAIGEATSMIVHDLKNSIGAIETAIDMIVDSIEDREFVLETLGLIKDSARNGLALAKDILDYTGNKKSEKSPMDGRELVNEVKKKIQPICEKETVKLTVHCPENLPFKGDYSKLYRVLFNLTNNAVEAFSGKKRSDSEIIISMEKEKRNIIITVSDNGSGIPDEIADKLFTPFVTCGKSGGTGLGLAITKQIIDAHGGTIAVGSSAGGGAEFKITLPSE
ncbi:MAG: ATP-binding protein [Kiritimatiellales bacterium]